MLQNSFKFDGKEFNDRIYFAHYLKKNFKRAVSYIADDTFLTILK